ncbi:hypothetical protein ACAF76_012840 [Brevibacillus sp. TJ4]|uniref:hypothetical protein n=1 Tax=Brevibacillus sp. TJ4 TaxID=3234853 RepID=UPI003B9FEF3A
MAEEVTVTNGPIQRNKLDVATELTKLYYAEYDIDDVEELQQTFAKMYAIAAYLESRSAIDLQELVPYEILKKVGR